MEKADGFLTHSHPSAPPRKAGSLTRQNTSRPPFAGTLWLVKWPVLTLPLTLAALLTLPAFLPLAEARPIAIGGVLVGPALESRPLNGSADGVPLGVLPRLGVVVRGAGLSGAAALSLGYADRKSVV